SAADFHVDATRLIQDIRSRGKLPLLSGGTMLYYKALREGLNALPPADPAIRRQIDQEAAQIGWPGLHRQLAGYDPETARRLAPNDSQRLQRAIEIYRSSGRSMSSWLQDAPARRDDTLSFVTVSLEPSDRLALHARIALRYRRMIEDGLLDEVRALYDRGDLHVGLPSIRCVGYRQLWDHLEGKISLEQAIEQATAATRQLAKRQLTWLRSQPEREVVDCLSGTAAEEVLRKVAGHWGQTPYGVCPLPSSTGSDPPLLGSDNNGLWRLGSFLLDDLAQAADLLALGGERGGNGVRLFGGDDDHHADPAIEYAMHFGIGHPAVLLQPGEQFRHGPGIAMQARRQPRLTNARHIVQQAPARDVREPLDGGAMLLQCREHGFDVDAGRLHDDIFEG